MILWSLALFNRERELELNRQQTECACGHGYLVSDSVLSLVHPLLLRVV